MSFLETFNIAVRLPLEVVLCLLYNLWIMFCTLTIIRDIENELQIILSSSKNADVVFV